MSNIVFYCAVGAFLFGVFVSSFVEVPLWAAAASAALAAAVLVVDRFVIRKTYSMSKQRLALFYVSVALLMFGAGSTRYYFERMHEQKSRVVLENRAGQNIVFEGEIVDDPDVRDRAALLKIRTEKIDGVQTALPLTLLVTVPVYPSYDYGDKVAVEGKIEMPEIIRDESGREFDYAAYLSREKIYYQMSFPKISAVSSDGGNAIYKILFWIKHFVLQKICSLLPEPHASLLAGILIGAKQSLGDKVLEQFRAAGVMHIVVLSGYNITIVAECIMRLLSFLSLAARGLLGSFSIVAFVILAGASATAVRSAIMALLVIVARALGRKYNVGRALFATAFLMVAWNPRTLAFDSGFQLSFLSTFALIYVSPLVEQRLACIRMVKNIRETLVSTISTQIFVLPLILYMMGTLSFVALFANIIILPLVPVSMGAGVAALGVSIILPFFVFPFSATVQGLLAAILFVTKLLSSIPFAAIIVPPFSAWWLLVAYVFVGFLLFRAYKKKQTVKLSKQ